MSEKPDPSEVEAIDNKEGVYERDSGGELVPLDWKVIEYRGEWRKVRPYPIPSGELNKYQQMGDDIDIDELLDVLADKFETPNRTVQEWEDTDPLMTIACIELLTELAMGETPSSEFHEEVKSELESRENQAGNSAA